MRGIYEIARLTMRESFKRRTATVAILFTTFLLVGMALLAPHIEHRAEQRRESRSQPAPVQVAGMLRGKKPAARIVEEMAAGAEAVIRSSMKYLR